MFRPGEIVDIPSPIDVHVHLREPGGTDKETIESGTAAALAGGYQAVFDMPNNPGGNETWTEDRLDQKIKIARETARINIGFYAGVNLLDPAFEEFPALVRKSAGLKLYMDHTTGNTTKHSLETVQPVIDEWVKQSREQGTFPPILLHAREEVGAETAEYVIDQQHHAHWCHLASEAEARQSALLTAQAPGLFTAGVTPHHLTMTSRNADFQQGWNGARMQPPLGEEADSEALLFAYNNGDIQILKTDHAPHTHEDKMNAEAENPSGLTDPGCTTCFGISGIEFVLPVMMSLVQRNFITMERLVDSLHDQPIRMLGLLPSVANAPNATRLEIRPYKIGEGDISGMSSNTPYIGWTAWAKVISVTRAGRSRDPHNYDPNRVGPIEILREGAIL